MALNLASIKAGKAAPILSNRGGREGRDLGPNVFLDESWPYNLKNSYDQAEPYYIVVAGSYVADVYKRGKRAGEPMDTERLDGDAADAVTLLRKAGAVLKIGVAIREYTDKGPKGETIPKGKVMIAYQGQKMREAKPKSVPVPVSPDTAPADPSVTGEVTEGATGIA